MTLRHSRGPVSALTLAASAFILFLHALPADAAPDKRPFAFTKEIGLREGLSGNKVTAIVKDSVGTLWVGTTNGLDRLYENKILHYDEAGFKNKNIISIANDRNNGIWVATRFGVFRYDHDSDSFSDEEFNGKPLHPLAIDDSGDGMVVSASDGIFLCPHRKEESIRRIVNTPQPYRAYNNIKVINDTTIIGTTTIGEVWKINAVNGDRKCLAAFDAYIGPQTLCRDTKGRIWVAVYGKGLYCLDGTDGRILKSFTSGDGGDSFGHKILLSISMDDKGLLWITTDGAGIKLLDTETFSFSGIEISPDIQAEIQNVNTMLADGDEMWFGTIRQGLVYLSGTSIRSLSGDDFGSMAECGVNRDIVSALCEDRHGDIWVGTDGNGLYIYNPRTGKLRHAGLDGEKVTSIENIDEDHLLLSLYSKGIYRLDKKTGRVSRIEIVDENTDRNVLSEDITIDLKKCPDGRLFVSSRQIFEYDIASGKIIRSNFDLSGTTCFVVKPVDPTSVILCNHFEIYRADTATGQIETIFRSQDGDINTTLLSPEKDILYLIKNYSICQINLRTLRLEEFPFPDNGDLLPVLESDSRGNIWTATNERLIRFIGTPADRYIVFNKCDGYRSPFALEGVSLISSSDELYFGGSAGLCIADIGSIENKAPAGRVFLSSVNVDQKKISHTSKANTVSSIRIPWNYQSLDMTVGVSGSNAFRAHRFRYTLLSSGKQTEIYSDNTLSLPGLSAGDYIVDISIKDDSDVWQPSGQTIEISITPPWWMSIAFTSGILAILAIIVILSVYIYHRREKIKADKIYQARKEKLTENKIHFLTNISHELRTPLTLIYAPLERLASDKSIGDRLKNELGRILFQVRYTIHLTNMILDTRKLEEGFSKLHMSEVRLGSFLNEVVDEFASEYAAKGIGLSCEPVPDEAKANFDKEKVHIILSNLLMNAYKYSEPGTNVRIATSTDGGKVRISVIDHGIGISGLDQDSIFGRFTQGNSLSKGFGLGLSYTKNLVETHPGGRIGAEPNPDGGSIFWFELPSSLDCNAAADNTFDPYPIQKEKATGQYPIYDGIDYDLTGSVALVVEDEQELLDFMCRELKPRFKNVLSATNGKAALEIAVREVPDIIISDVMMPEMDGYELCRNVKNNLSISHIPVILLTGCSEQAHRELGYKSGADVFLTKPFDIPTLLAAIKNTLHSREIIRRRYQDAANNVSAAEGTFSNADEQFMTMLDSYIDENISNQDLNVDMILKHIGMGRASFYSKFKGITGIGIMEYVTGKRMKAAQALLKDSRLTISEIAYQIGYSDNQYFSRAFRQNFNMPPSQYRKMLLDSHREPNEKA